MNFRDPATFTDAYERYAVAVYATARRILGDGPGAEDVVQEVFLEVWRRPDAYDPARGALRSWLCAIARNKAIDQLRRAERHANALAAVATPSAGEDAAEPALRQALAVAVREAVKSLPTIYRTTIVLAYYHGFSYRQVAMILSIPEGTAKSRLRLGLRRLGDLLAEQVTPTK